MNKTPKKISFYQDLDKSDFSTLLQRLKEGKEAVFKYAGRAGVRSKPITVAGVTYPSISRACKAFRIPYARVNSRLNNLWTIEETFDLVPRLTVYKRVLPPVEVEHPPEKEPPKPSQVLLPALPFTPRPRLSPIIPSEKPPRKPRSKPKPVRPRLKEHLT